MPTGNYTLTIIEDVGSGWLSATLDTSQAFPRVLVAIDPTTVPVDTEYTGSIEVSDPLAANSPQVATVKFTKRSKAPAVLVLASSTGPNLTCEEGDTSTTPATASFVLSNAPGNRMPLAGPTVQSIKVGGVDVTYAPVNIVALTGTMTPGGAGLAGMGLGQ